MKHHTLVALTLACTACATSAPDAPPAPAPPSPAPADFDALRLELLEMMEVDQEYRDYERIMALPRDEQQVVMREAGEADRRHTARLAEVVAEHGWPTRSMVGEDGSYAAFILVQHADASPQFQADCLPLLEAAAQRGEVGLVDFAYLTDRVRVKQKRPQLYGTQYEVVSDASGAALADEDGNLQYLVPVVENLEKLDARRREAGLTPWIEYERSMASSQGREPAEQPRSADDMP